MDKFCRGCPLSILSLGNSYRALLIGSGVLLAGLGLLLVWEGVQHFL